MFYAEESIGIHVNDGSIRVEIGTFMAEYGILQISEKLLRQIEGYITTNWSGIPVGEAEAKRIASECAVICRAWIVKNG